MNTHRLTEEPSNRLPSPKRVVAAVATALGLALLAACGGGGGGGAQSGSAPGLLPTTTSGQPVAQATAVPTVTTTGTIVSVNAGYFVLSPPAPHGKINVYSNTSTQIIGAQPYAGETVTVYATGAWGASLTAIWVTQAGFSTPTPGPAPTATPTAVPAITSPTPSPGATFVPTITSTGTVVSVDNGYFVFNPGPPHGKINVYTNASTQYIGAKPFAGESVTVNGAGSWGASWTAIWIAQAGFATPTPVAAPTPVATSTPVAVTNVPVHIPTWAFDEYWSMGANASSATVQSYVTYAEGGLGNSKAQQDCATSPKSCHSVAYMDPNLIYADALCPRQPDAQIMSTSSESWFVHQAGYSDAAHRAQGSYNRTCNGAPETIPVYLLNQADPGVVAWYKSFVQNNLDNWDYYWFDVTKTTVANQAFGPGGSFCPGVSACSTTQEYPTDASVLSAHISFADSLAHVNGSPLQIFFNGFTFNTSTGGLQNQSLIQQDPNHFIGGICENCIVNNGVFETSNYVPVLNAMLQLGTMPGAQYVQLDTGSSPSGSAAQISQRTTALAMAWLGYSDGHIVIFPNFEYNTQNLAVWPEDLVYPGAPVQSMQWSANDIQVAGNVYRREFRQCFYNQQSIGPCAAIINANSSAVAVANTWLTQTYAHQIAVSGGDISSGGTLSTTSTAFTPNVTTIAPGQGILLAQ